MFTQCEMPESCEVGWWLGHTDGPRKEKLEVVPAAIGESSGPSESAAAARVPNGRISQPGARRGPPPSPAVVACPQGEGRAVGFWPPHLPFFDEPGEESDGSPQLHPVSPRFF